MKKSDWTNKITVLIAVSVLAVAGWEYVSKTPPAIGAEVTWDWPEAQGCYTATADGFFVRVIVDGNPVKTDTVFTNTWQGALDQGTTTVKVAAFYLSDVNRFNVGFRMNPDCTLTADTLWSPASNPIFLRPQPGAISKPIISVIIK